MHSGVSQLFPPLAKAAAQKKGDFETHVSFCGHQPRPLLSSPLTPWSVSLSHPQSLDGGRGGLARCPAHVTPVFLCSLLSFLHWALSCGQCGI